MASRLQDVILRGTAASRPLATAVAPGTLYYSTDTITTDRSDGTNWETYADAGSGSTRIEMIGMLIDGGGSAITTGVKGYLQIPYTATIQAVTLLADVSGSIVIDIWKDTYANYPPTVADTITAAAKPTISAALKSQDTTLTGWTTAITADDVLGFNVDSASTVTKVSLILKVQV